MRVFFERLGTAALWLMLGPLYLGFALLILPYIAMHLAISEAVARMRREPRPSLPNTGVSLVSEPDAQANPEMVAEAIISRCTRDVAAVAQESGVVQLTSDFAIDPPVVIRTSEEPFSGLEVEVDVGPWTVNSPEGMDFGEGDAAVAMAVAYLDHGLTCRKVKDRTIALLWLADPGVWWRPTADGGGTFRQTWFSDLPGEPATATERAQHLASTRALQSE